VNDIPKLNILLYCNRPDESENAGTVIDHIDAFQKHSRHEIFLWSSLMGLPSDGIMSKVDCIVIHYTLSLLYDKYIPRDSLETIRSFKGLKILFLQDEYRRVNFVCEKIKYAKIDLVFTCAPQDVASKIYAAFEDKLKFHTTLTGFVPEALIDIEAKPIANRTIDVGYRARKCPFWLGEKSHDKFLIGSLFANHTKSKGLNNDISSKEKDRIYGKQWIEFLSNCKATLGTESGASLIDFTGEIEYRLNRYQAFHPFSDFSRVPQKLLAKDGEIELQVISPRCFEAAVLGTVMILYPGDYSGILKAGKHYLLLEKDFSNVDEVVEQLRDHEGLEQIAGQAKQDLVQSGKYSFEHFILDFDQVIEDLREEKRWVPVNQPIGLLVAQHSEESGKDQQVKGLKLTLLLFFSKVWKNMPHWFRFLVSVTVLRKNFYSHLDVKKNAFLKLAD